MSTTAAIKNVAGSIKPGSIKVEDVKTHATAVATKALHVGAGAGDLAVTTARAKATAVVDSAKARVAQGIEAVTTTYRDLAERGEGLLAKGDVAEDADVSAGDVAKAPVVKPADS